MFTKQSLITRIAVGKSVGFVVGLVAFICIPCFMPDASLFLRWGVFLWYITFGAIIGIFGVMTRVPVLNVCFPWWIRGPCMGAWLNFVLSLIAYNTLSILMISIFSENGLIASPFWVVLEGFIIGFIIDFLATKFGGEGRLIVDDNL